MSEPRTTTVNLEEEIARIEEKVETLEEAKDELRTQFEEEYGDYANVPDDEESKWERLDEKVVEQESTLQALQRAVDEYHGTQFRIQELDMGAVAEIQDNVAEESFEFDAEEGEIEDGVPKSGYGKLETMRRSIIQQPPQAPARKDAMGNDIPEPGAYPPELGEFLFEKINSFNAMGDTDMGNSSLQEEMRS